MLFLLSSFLFFTLIHPSQAQSFSFFFCFFNGIPTLCFVWFRSFVVVVTCELSFFLFHPLTNSSCRKIYNNLHFTSSLLVFFLHFLWGLLPAGRRERGNFKSGKKEHNKIDDYDTKNYFLVSGNKERKSSLSSYMSWRNGGKLMSSPCPTPWIPSSHIWWLFLGCETESWAAAAGSQDWELVGNLQI